MGVLGYSLCRLSPMCICLCRMSPYSGLYIPVSLYWCLLYTVSHLFLSLYLHLINICLIYIFPAVKPTQPLCSFSDSKFPYPPFFPFTFSPVYCSMLILLSFLSAVSKSLSSHSGNEIKHKPRHTVYAILDFLQGDR